MFDYPFIYSRPELKPFPLGSYFPEYRPGLTSSWIASQANFQGLVLTPFSSSPQVILEAARSGCRILAPAHNPILRFLITNLSEPISRDSLNSSLVRLASSSKGGQRIKPTILDLYQTECPQCGGQTIAVSFLWSREKNQPQKKVCRCSSCGEDTQGDVSASDIARALDFPENSPYHARALTRVSTPDDPIRIQVETALRSYPPRSVYALFTIFNKMAGLNLSPEEKSGLEMLLLSAFYQASSPTTRLQAENLPDSDQKDHYQEVNIWFIMEEALDAWSHSDPSIPLTTWPELPPPSGGICIYPGRIRDLVSLLKQTEISLILLGFPQPRSSFWILSTLWSGWLWGQEAVAPLRSNLSTRNMDWSWMSRAVETSLTELRSCLPVAVPCLGYLPEISIPYLVSSLSAGWKAGFSLDYLALEPDLNIALTSWTASTRAISSKPTLTRREIIRKAGLDALKLAGEPLPPSSLYGAGMVELIAQDALGEDPALEDHLELLLKDFEENIAYRQGYLFYTASGTWWHQDLDLSASPRSDQLEQSVVNLLVKSPTPLPETDLFEQIYREYPGLITPGEIYLKTILESYAEITTEEPRKWALKENDQPINRRKDLDEIQLILARFGEELGFTVKNEDFAGNIIHQVWGTEVAGHYNFFISASGLLNPILTQGTLTLTNAWIILPASRAGLIHYKLRKNPELEKTISNHYQLVKFRHIRRLADQGGLSHANIQERLKLDPFTSESAQIPLI